MTQTLQEFLESEKKEFDDLMVLTDSTVNLPLWLSSHDSRLIAHLREILSLTVSDVHSVGWAYWDSDYYPTPSEMLELTEHFNKMIDKKLSLLTPPTKV